MQEIKRTAGVGSVESVEAVERAGRSDIKNNDNNVPNEGEGHGTVSVSPKRPAASLKKTGRCSSNPEKVPRAA